MAFRRALGGRSLDDGMRAVGVSPGPVAADRIVRIMKTRAVGRWGDAVRYTELLADALGRTATVSKVKDLFAFLDSPRSSYTSTTIITLDGGLSSRRSI
jgi:NAD(P)-dependent dehydrogenase (short-subunit alcohol dehydrogenase family)